MKKITAMLIDDEISAINTLRGMLNQYFPQVEVVAESRSVGDALLKVSRYQPDVVFLDVEMPPFGSGFDFLTKSKQYGFGVIFVTAYPKYAVQAINEVQPWAYIIKPVNVAGLADAVETALEKLNQTTSKEPKISPTQSIIISDARKGNIVIRVLDIVYCQADGTTTDIFFEKGGKMVRMTASRTLKDIEEQLPDSCFFRSHHSFLINLLKVERYERTGRNGVVHFVNGAEAPISVAKMEEFERTFNQFLQHG